MSGPTFWLTIGFLGQGLFTARFLVQWLASEHRRETVVPSAFWWLSLFGGAALLAYAVSRRDPVIVLGQSFGLFVYARNLVLIDQSRRRNGNAARRTPVRGPLPTVDDASNAFKSPPGRRAERPRSAASPGPA